MQSRSNVVLLLSGAALLIGAVFQIVPAVALGLSASPDGHLTDELRSSLRHAQLVFGCALFTVGLCASWIENLARPLLRGVLQVLPRYGFEAGLLLLSFSFAMLVQVAMFDNMPHVTDATSHLFQAKILTLGRIAAPLPDSYEHFMDFKVLMSANGLWHTKYTPGHPLYLALFMKAGAVDIAVPLAHALCAILLSRIADRFYGQVLARSAGLLFATSPLALLLAGSYMSHTPALLFALACVWLGLQGSMDERFLRDRIVRLTGAGFFAGMTAITRPQDFAMLGLILAMGLLFSLPDIRPRVVLRAFMAVPGFVLPMGILLLWNHTLYGSPFQLGYGNTSELSLTAIHADSFGFSSDYTLSHAFSVFQWTLLRFNAAMLGWPSSLLAAAFAFAFFPWDRRDWFCLSASCSIVAIYFFYNYYGFEYEARYYYGTLPFLCCLTVRGIIRIYAFTKHLREKHFPSWVMTGLLPGVVTACLAYAIAHYWPAYIWPRYHDSYEQGSRIVQRTCEQSGISNAVVLIDCSGANAFRYTSGMPFNDPLLRGEVIYARDLPEKNEELLAGFQNRDFYRFVPDTTWNSGHLKTLSNR